METGAQPGRLTRANAGDLTRVGTIRLADVPDASFE